MRKRMYVVSANFMIFFERWAERLEHIYSVCEHTFFNFDFGHEMWRKKRLWMEEQREVKRRQREITERQGRGDQVSEVIAMLETVADGEGVKAEKERIKL